MSTKCNTKMLRSWASTISAYSHTKYLQVYKFLAW